MPRTEAGKAFDKADVSNLSNEQKTYAIDAIEAEANTVEVSTLYGYDAGVAAERERIRTAVELWDSPWLNRAEVLDIIDKESE